MAGSKTISNATYIKLAIIPNHIPVSHDFGDQRDPWIFITCSCQTKTHPYPNREALKKGEWTFVEHLIEILDKEFNFIDNK